MISVQVKVAEKIKEIAPEVEDIIITTLVNREVNRRSNVLTKAIDNLSQLEGERRKIKPDVVSFNSDGTEAASAYTKAKLEETKKLDQRIDKLTKAIEKALTTSDYGDVYNLDKAGNNPKSDRDESPTETDGSSDR